MKNILLPLLLLASIFALVPEVLADGIYEEPRPVRRQRVQKVVEEPIPPPPVCTPSSDAQKVKLLSWDPVQKVSKFLGVLQECVTDQWEVLRLLSGPNTIGLHYPDEREMWGYRWLWRYQLRNPIEDTLILMDKSGKRIQKGKDPVELYLSFNKDDVLERIEMVLIKKKNSQYVLFP